MRTGELLILDGGELPSLDELIRRADRARAAGLRSVWLSTAFGMDPLTAWAAVGQRVGKLELGTAVVPIQPRHPIALAQRAVTTQAAVGRRLTGAVNEASETKGDGR